MPFIKKRYPPLFFGVKSEFSSARTVRELSLMMEIWLILRYYHRLSPYQYQYQYQYFNCILYSNIFKASFRIFLFPINNIIAINFPLRLEFVAIFFISSSTSNSCIPPTVFSVNKNVVLKPVFQRDTQQRFFFLYNIFPSQLLPSL